MAIRSGTLLVLAAAAGVGLYMYEKNKKDKQPAAGGGGTTPVSPLQVTPTPPVNTPPTEATQADQMKLLAWFGKYQVGAQQATQDGNGIVFAAAKPAPDASGNPSAIPLEALLTKVITDKAQSGSTIMVPAAYVTLARFGDEAQLPAGVTVLAIASSGVAAAKSSGWVVLMNPQPAASA